MSVLLSLALVGALLLAALLYPAPVARAATITVCASGCDYTGIQQAVNAALPGDTSQLAAETYTEADITLDKNLTLVGQGAGRTIVQAHASAGSATQRVFTVNSGVTAALSRMTVRHGVASGADGGGIYNAGTLTVQECAIVDNSATWNLGQNGRGGGIYNRHTLTVVDSTISGNTSEMGGGGIENDGSGDGASTTVRNSTISGNTGYNGGGVENLDGTLALYDSTVTGNRAEGLDGGYGGGIENWQSGGTATTTYENTILYGNSAQDLGNDCDNLNGTLTSQGYNLFATGTRCATSATDVTTGDAKLDTLGDNGGDTRTHALLESSPAIDAIPIGVNGCSASNVDQRDAQRANGADAGGTACDIGAYERSNTFDRAIGGLDMVRMHKALIEVTTLGTLSRLVVEYVPTDHPNADAYTRTGQYWTVAPTGSGYTVNLTLPHNGTPDSQDQVCRYTGVGENWDCAMDSFDTAASTITRNGVTQFSDWTTADNAPTAARLGAFSAEPDGSGVRLYWETTTELDTLGFHLYRAESPDGPRTRLTEALLPCQTPGSPQGGAYTYLDLSTAPGQTYSYWLEHVDVQGGTALYGPVQATTLKDPAHRIYIPMLIN